MEANSSFDLEANLEILRDLGSLTSIEFDELFAGTANIDIRQIRDHFLQSIPDFKVEPKRQRSVKSELKRFTKKCDRYERGIQQLSVIVDEQTKMLQSAAFKLSHSKGRVDYRATVMEINDLMVSYEYQVENQISEIIKQYDKIQKKFDSICKKLEDEKMTLTSKMEKLADDIRTVNFVKKQSQKVIEGVLKATEFLNNEE